MTRTTTHTPAERAAFEAKAKAKGWKAMTFTRAGDRIKTTQAPGDTIATKQVTK